MKTFVAAAVIVIASVHSCTGQEKKEENTLTMDKWNVKALEDGFGLKLTKLVIPSPGTYLLVFEFTKDIDDVVTLRKALANNPKDKKFSLLFYAFDEDNVILFNRPPSYTEGEVTGKAGDAFRLRVLFESSDRTKAKKVEARLVK